MSNQMAIMLCNCLLPIQLSVYQIDWAIIKSIELMSNRMTIMLCNCLLPIQLSIDQIDWVDVKPNDHHPLQLFIQIDWAIIKSIGLMSNRMTIMFWTIIHDTLRTDSASFSNKITITTTMSCQMFKSMILCVALISKNGEDNPSRQFYCFALYFLIVSGKMS